MVIWKFCLALGKMQQLKKGTSKNTILAEKSMDTKHGNLLLLHVASASDPKLSKLMGMLQQHFSTLDSTTASNPEQGLTVPVLLQINSLSYKAAGNRNQADVPILVPKPLVWLHKAAYTERVHKGQGDAGYRHRKLSPNTPSTDLQTPCTGLFRRAHSTQHSFPSANLSISTPICINIFFLQRERQVARRQLGRRSLELSFYLQISVWVRNCKLSNLVQALPVVTSAPTAPINSVEKLQQRSNNRASKYSSLCFLFVNWWHKKDSQAHVLQSAIRCCDILKGKGPTASTGLSVISI